MKYIIFSYKEMCEILPEIESVSANYYTLSHKELEYILNLIDKLNPINGYEFDHVVGNKINFVFKKK